MVNAEDKGKSARAYYACKNQIPKRRIRDKRPYNCPVERIFGSLSIEDRVDNELLYISSRGFIEQQFFRMSENPAIAEKQWLGLHKERVRTYRAEPDTPFFPTIEDFCINSSIDVYPLPILTEKYIYGEHTQVSISDIYRGPTPTLSLIKFYHNQPKLFPDLKDVYPERYSSLIRHMPGSLTKLSNDDRKNLTSLKLTGEIGMSESKLSIIYTNNEEYLNSFINPWNISNIIYESDFLETRLPILKEKYRPSLIKRKKEVYGRIFELEEEQLYQELNLSREMIKAISSLRGDLSFEEFEFALFNYLFPIIEQIYTIKVGVRRIELDDDDSDDDEDGGPSLLIHHISEVHQATERVRTPDLDSETCDVIRQTYASYKIAKRLNPMLDPKTYMHEELSPFCRVLFEKYVVPYMYEEAPIQRGLEDYLDDDPSDSDSE